MRPTKTATATPDRGDRDILRSCATGALGAVLALLMVFPGTSSADVPNDHSGSPSVDQYVESVPTGTGKDRRSRGSTKDERPAAELPPEARRRLDPADPAARDLGDVATSTELGAPTSDSMARDDREGEDGGRDGRSGSARDDGGAAAEGGAGPGEVGDASRSSAPAQASAGGVSPLLLGLALLAMTAGALALAYRRRGSGA